MNETIESQDIVVRTSRGLTIAGTRITVYQIMDYIKAGRPAEIIRDHFRLTIKQTNDVLEYIETHQEEIETEYQEVLEYAQEIREYWEERNQKLIKKIRSMPPKPERKHLYAKLQADKARLGMV